jgi:hypothetical protein
MPDLDQNKPLICTKGGLNLTNRNDNRESKNKYPNNKKQDTEFSKEINIRSEETKKDLKK